MKIKGKLKNINGITLIALVVTIIVLIILSAVTMNLLIGDNGLITRAQEASFRAEMAAIRESVEMRKQQCVIENKLITEIFKEQLTIEDARKWDIGLKMEVIYWGQYEIGVTKLTREYAKEHWEEILKSKNTDTGLIDNLYYIDKATAGGKEYKYLYDTKVDKIYKVPNSNIGKYKVHSIEELEYQKKWGNGERDPLAGTLITEESTMITVGTISHYEPDLTGFVLEKTKLIYYSINTGNSIEIEAKEYIEQGKPRTIEKEGTIYEFYDYENSKWANILVESSGIKTYWVWIPRYAYKIDTTNTTTEIQFLALEDVPQEGYILHSNFEDGKKGIWASKYEVKQVANSEVAEFPYYIPDMTGFNKRTTYVEVYNEETESFIETKLANIENLEEFSRDNKWFDYENQVWANIKTVSNGVESWWVWIPRYAYNISGTTTSIIFLDIYNNPLTGEELPSNYIVHPAFEDGKKGIWVSKYEPIQTIADRPTTNNVNMPDMTGFDPENTYIEVYNEDTQTFTEVKLASIDNLETFAKENKWYDYGNQIWANIKTVANGVESWWVWIPRYAYNITGIETTIIYLDEDGNPIDGSTLPSNYIPHPAFNEVKTGIWASKYEPKEK